MFEIAYKLLDYRLPLLDFNFRIFNIFKHIFIRFAFNKLDLLFSHTLFSGETFPQGLGDGFSGEQNIPQGTRGPVTSPQG